MSEESWRGQVGRLNESEMSTFLGEAHLARLACLDDEGWPYVVPCWHEWDGESFWVIPREKSAWARYLANDSRCAISVDEAEGLRKVVAQCTARMVEEPNVGGRWVPIAERMSTRYLGENGPKYLEPTLDKPRWLFRLNPENLQTWLGLSEAGGVYLMVSGQYALSTQEPPYPDLFRVTRRFAEAYGPERLLWASDYPWTRDVPGYRAMPDLVPAALPDLDSENLARVLSGTARTLFPHLAGEPTSEPIERHP